MRCKDCNSANSININNKHFCVDCGGKAVPAAAADKSGSTASTPQITKAKSTARAGQLPKQPPATPSQTKKHSVEQKSGHNQRRAEKAQQITRNQAISRFNKPRSVAQAAAATPTPNAQDGRPHAPVQPTTQAGASAEQKAAPQPAPQPPTAQPEPQPPAAQPERPHSPHLIDLRKQAATKGPSATRAAVDGPLHSAPQPPAHAAQPPSPPSAPKAPTPPVATPPRPQAAAAATTAPPKAAKVMQPEQDYHVKNAANATTNEELKSLEVLKTVQESQVRRRAAKAKRLKVKRGQSWLQKSKRGLALILAKPRRSHGAIAAVAVVIIIGGYITYLNLPNLGLRVAASRAGITAQMPHYTPSGYSFSGPIAYAPGTITINFASSTGELITLKQQSTDWDSESLLNDYVSRQADNYLTFQERGLKIYLYNDTNATWVNRGVWYTIETSGQVNPEQLIRMASSL